MRETLCAAAHNTRNPQSCTCSPWLASEVGYKLIRLPCALCALEVGAASLACADISSAHLVESFLDVRPASPWSALAPRHPQILLTGSPASSG